MTDRDLARDELYDDRAYPTLFFGILAPPVLWAARFGVSYVLVPYVCANGWTWLLHAITGGTIAAIVAVGIGSWRRWRSGPGANPMPEEALGTWRFMSLVGVLSAAFFLLVTLAEGLANFFVHPCQQAGVPIA